MTDKFNVIKSTMLPPVFRWVGFGIAAATFAVAFVLHGSKEWLFIPMILGLLIAMWSRERHDDEMMRQIRLTAAFVSISSMAVWVIVWRILGLNLSMDIPIFGFLILYHLRLAVARMTMRRDEKHD